MHHKLTDGQKYLSTPEGWIKVDDKAIGTLETATAVLILFSLASADAKLPDSPGLMSGNSSW